MKVTLFYAKILLLKLKKNIKVNQANQKLKNSQGSSQHGLESLKGELKIRDDLVQKLRQEILDLQEKRDQALLDVRYYFKQLTNNGLLNAK